MLSVIMFILLAVSAAFAVDPALIGRVKVALPEPGGATTLLYAADPWLVSLLTTGGAPARDMRGESPVVDLIDTSLTLTGTLLTGRTCGQGVVMREVVLHLDTGGGPSPDLRLTISLTGVLSMILRGDWSALAGISFNRGDLMFASSLVSFGLYSALMPRRPVLVKL